MQYFTSDMVVLIMIMALSWLVSFISQICNNAISCENEEAID
jgi:hypothetical protein